MKEPGGLVKHWLIRVCGSGPIGRSIKEANIRFRLFIYLLDPSGVSGLGMLGATAFDDDHKIYEGFIFVHAPLLHLTSS